MPKIHASHTNAKNKYRPAVRIHHHGKHYIVYLIEADHFLIVRVLRDEVDLTRHL